MDEEFGTVLDNKLWMDHCELSMDQSEVLEYFLDDSDVEGPKWVNMNNSDLLTISNCLRQLTEKFLLNSLDYSTRSPLLIVCA